jgi:ATP-dependent DNA helicase RecG
VVARGGGVATATGEKSTAVGTLSSAIALRLFASLDELTPDEAAEARLRGRPRPSRLHGELGLRNPAKDAAASIGLETVGDLLEHLPREHDDRRETRHVATLMQNERVTIEVEVRHVAVKPMRQRNRKRVEARVADETGPLVAVWWNQAWVADKLQVGGRVLLHGKLKPRNQFHVDEYEVLSGGGGVLQEQGLMPVYPATEKLGSQRIRQLVWAQKDRVHDVVEPLPGRLMAAERLPLRSAALSAVHFPESPEDSLDGRERLAFEELLMLELSLAARKRARAEGKKAPVVEGDGTLVDPWLAGLPFAPTGDQQNAFERIEQDMASDRPMQRLLMGEVGSGKTVVALNAMLRAAETGHQAALMAPTETLAEQHMLTLDRLLGGLVPIGLLTGSTPAARRREILGRLGSGELSLVVGTHALIEPVVEFRSLGVAVVDEQHRFGVRQRAALDAKAPGGLAPHVLHMTATPIPRTLALTAYGDLDVTTLRELPAGRKPITTHAVDGARHRARAYERAREEIDAGRQVFVVCPLVSESETLQAKAATTEAERLAETEFKGYRVALIHGQMPSKAKAEAMARFAAREADVLVATSVIEVGIDVPNATVMMIEAAERYGISQLHQLRGRIGRGEHAGLCILFGDPALPRLEALAGERDGFRLAEVDLQLRGAGEVLGTRQHGLPQFRVARIPEDAELLGRARDRAEELLAADPDLSLPEHALLKAAAAQRFGSELDPIPA